MTFKHLHILLQCSNMAVLTKLQEALFVSAVKGSVQVYRQLLDTLILLLFYLKTIVEINRYGKILFLYSSILMQKIC